MSQLREVLILNSEDRSWNPEFRLANPDLQVEIQNSDSGMWIAHKSNAESKIPTPGLSRIHHFAFRMLDSECRTPLATISKFRVSKVGLWIFPAPGFRILHPEFRDQDPNIPRSRMLNCESRIHVVMWITPTPGFQIANP